MADEEGMKRAPIAANEAERIEELLRYEILDTIEEQIFDDITLLASQICETPIALISLVDKDRQWFKSKVGLGAPQTARDISFCGHAIHGREVFEIQNAKDDSRFFDNPLSTDAPNVIFYAGAPLITPKGQAIGTLCVIDHVPRLLSEKQKTALSALSRHVISILEHRMRSTESLRSQNHTNALFEAMTEGVVIQDSVGKITQFNPAALRILGLSEDQLLGKASSDPDWKSIRPDGSPFEGKDHPAMKVLATGLPQRDTEMGIDSRAGGRRWIRINAVPVMASPEDPGTLSALSTFADITQLRDTLAQLDRFFSVSVDILGIACEEGKFQRFNPALERILGYSGSELLKAKFLDFVHPEDFDATQKQLEMLRKGAEKVDFVNRFRTRRGDYLSLDWRIKSDTLTGLLYFSARDISQQLLHQQELLHLARQSTIGQLAAGMSHEINNPLAIISLSINAASVANRESNRARIEALLDKQIRAVNRIKEITDALGELGGTDPYLRPENGDTISECFERSRTLLGTDLERRRINLKASIPPGLGAGIASSKLTQVFIMLLHHASDALTNQNEKNIQVTATSEADQIAIELSYSGPALPHDTQSKLKSGTVLNVSTELGHGLNLGLCKALIESAGGVLTYKAACATSCFRIKIPLMAKKTKTAA